MRKFIQMLSLVTFLSISAGAQTPPAIQVIVDGKTYTCGSAADSACAIEAQADQYKFQICLPSYGQSYCFNQYFNNKPSPSCVDWIKACYTNCEASFGQAYCSNYCSK